MDFVCPVVDVIDSEFDNCEATKIIAPRLLLKKLMNSSGLRWGKDIGHASVNELLSEKFDL